MTRPNRAELIFMIATTAGNYDEGPAERVHDQVIVPLLAEARREGAEQALREAADSNRSGIGTVSLSTVVGWLDARADNVAKGDRRCCDMHNEHCEPPGDLCCNECTEVDHGFFPPRPHDCVLDGVDVRKVRAGLYIVGGYEVEDARGTTGWRIRDPHYLQHDRWAPTLGVARARIAAWSRVNR